MFQPCHLTVSLSVTCSLIYKIRLGILTSRGVWGMKQCIEPWLFKVCSKHLQHQHPLRAGSWACPDLQNQGLRSNKIPLKSRAHEHFRSPVYPKLLMWIKQASPGLRETVTCARCSEDMRTGSRSPIFPHCHSAMILKNGTQYANGCVHMPVK